MSSSGRAVRSVLGRGLRLVGWLLVGSALYGAFFYALFALGVERTIGRRADRLRHQVWEMEKEIRAAEGTQARVAEFDAEVGKLAAELEHMALVLPDEHQLEALEAQLVDASADRRVILADLVVGLPDERDFYARIPLEIRARGAFDGLSGFTADLGQLERLVVLRGIRLERDGSSFSATLQADAFHWR